MFKRARNDDLLQHLSDKKEKKKGKEAKKPIRRQIIKDRPRLTLKKKRRVRRRKRLSKKDRHMQRD